MRTLDRYVLIEFLRLFIVIAAGIVALYIIINFFEQMNTLIAKKPNPLHILLYYWYQVPYLLVLLMPVALLLATFFSLGEFAMRNELLAMKASGVDILRTFVPILLFGATVTALTLWGNMALVPSWMEKARETKAVKILKRETARLRTQAEDLAFFGTGRRFFFFKRIDARQSTGSGILIMDTDTLGRVIRRIDATRGEFRDGRWVLWNAVEREFRDGVEITKRHDKKDYPEITESPFELLKSPKELTDLTVPDLSERIKALRRAGMEYYSETVEMNVRYSFPFMNFIILLFALPLAASMRGVSRAWGFGISIMVAFFYWAFLQASRTIGDTGGMNPVLSAWLPNAVFLILSLPAFLRVKR
ncbi:MAG: LptF/LptG family permease [candidate division WOR-3 bacterium]